MSLAMQPAPPDQTSEIENYRPACSRCGSRMMLVRIELTDEPDHDLRTFECLCGHAERVKIKLR